MIERPYELKDLVALLGMKESEASATSSLVNSCAAKIGLSVQTKWTFNDAVEILNAVAAEPGLHRVFARCAIARLYATRTKRGTA
jgi:hypothetical protein